MIRCITSKHTNQSWIHADKKYLLEINITGSTVLKNQQLKVCYFVYVSIAYCCRVILTPYFPKLGLFVRCRLKSNENVLGLFCKHFS